MVERAPHRHRRTPQGQADAWKEGGFTRRRIATVPAQVPSSNFMSLRYLPSAANPVSWHSWIAVPFAEKTRWPNFSFSGLAFAREISDASTRRVAASPGSSNPQRSNVRETTGGAARF